MDNIILISIFLAISCIVFFVKKQSDKTRKAMLDEMEDEQDSSN